MSVEEWYSVTNLASLVGTCFFSGFVSHRLWRMVARDSIFERPREALFPEGTWRFDLIDCPWCLGWWLNVGYAALMYFAVDLSFPSAVIVAFVGSTITGVLGRGD
jgi:hypothetical protein